MSVRAPGAVAAAAAVSGTCGCWVASAPTGTGVPSTVQAATATRLTISTVDVMARRSIVVPQPIGTFLPTGAGVGAPGHDPCPQSFPKHER